jgi:uncharacterized membrane protein
VRAILARRQPWAALSAVFAPLTAIFSKIGIENVNPIWAQPAASRLSVATALGSFDNLSLRDHFEICLRG